MLLGLARRVDKRQRVLGPEFVRCASRSPERGAMSCTRLRLYSPLFDPEGGEGNRRLVGEIPNFGRFVFGGIDTAFFNQTFFSQHFRDQVLYVWRALGGRPPARAGPFCG